MCFLLRLGLPLDLKNEKIFMTLTSLNNKYPFIKITVIVES